MPSKDIQHKRNELLAKLSETANRIRHYSLDPRLRRDTAPPTSARQISDTTPDLGEYLREKAEEAWEKWMELRNNFAKLPESPTLAELDAIEEEWLNLDRKVDLVQRDLIGKNSFNAGIVTVTWLALVLILSVVFYLVSHGVRGWSLVGFEPWPEWGPWKYAEVAYWSSFGILCYLLFTSTYYIARRDFDEWYKLWYVSTFLRAPFLTVILMMVVLEFVEWYGEGKWIETYILEEGNKTYFIAFMSFCLGISSDVISSIIRDLSEGVSDFVKKAVSRVSQRLSSAVSDVNITPS
jgi:hypothetical protein